MLAIVKDCKIPLPMQCDLVIPPIKGWSLALSGVLCWPKGFSVGDICNFEPRPQSLVFTLLDLSAIM